MIQEVSPQTVAAGVTFLLGVFDALRRYRRDGDIKLHQLPWIEFRALFMFARKRLFTITRPDHPTFSVDMSVQGLTETLGRQGVKPKHPFSYRYGGEVYNGVMYHHDASRRYSHRQIHVRAFKDGDRLSIQCHEEPHWWHHPVAHIRSKNMEFEPANEWTKQRLENEVPVGYPGN
jgi:hypothetical protein